MKIEINDYIQKRESRMNWTEIQTNEGFIEAGNILIHSSDEFIKEFAGCYTCFFKKEYIHEHVKGHVYEFIVKKRVYGYFYDNDNEIRIDLGEYDNMYFDIEYIGKK